MASKANGLVFHCRKKSEEDKGGKGGRRGGGGGGMQIDKVASYLTFPGFHLLLDFLGDVTRFGRCHDRFLKGRNS